MIEIKAKEILEESIEQFESSKGSISSGVKKLRRAAELMEITDIVAWCELQLGNTKHIEAAKEFVEAFLDIKKEAKNKKEKAKKETSFRNAGQKLIKLGHNLNDLSGFNSEINYKYNESSGGWNNIGFIEEKYNDLVRTKKGNDDTYYKTNLNGHLSQIKANGHRKASSLLNRIEFKSLPKSNFDYLKEMVDDKLFDLNPEIAEQLMIAFKSISSDNDEEWSQALTTCRRLIEKLADTLFPPQKELHNGRKVGRTQYINRLWAFMDLSIESNTNKELAKSHMNFIGKYIESVHKVTNKGVHTAISKMEAVKTLFHVYLMLADLLDYLSMDIKGRKSGKIDINKATLDELEALGNIKRSTAKEIIKSRVKHKELTVKILEKTIGIGPKTILKLKNSFSI